MPYQLAVFDLEGEEVASFTAPAVATLGRPLCGLWSQIKAGARGECAAYIDAAGRVRFDLHRITDDGGKVALTDEEMRSLVAASLRASEADARRN